MFLRSVSQFATIQPMKLALALLFSIGLQAAPVITVSCNPEPCNQNGYQNLSNFSVGATSFQLAANAGTSGFFGPRSLTVDISYDFTTAGPVRVGMIHVFGVASADGSFGGGGSANFTFPGGSCIGGILQCGKNAFFAVQLGTVMTVNAHASSGAQLVNAGGGADANVTIELFEADGRTPVALLDAPGAAGVPEPQSAAMLLGGLVLIGAQILKR